MKGFVLGVDIGTSGCKCTLLDDLGNLVASASSEYMAAITGDGYAEQSPLEWYQAMVLCLREFNTSKGINLHDIASVCATGQMQGATFLDNKGKPARPSILWNDLRSVVESDEINEKMGDSFVDATSFAATSSLTICKYLWVRKNEPEIFNNISKITFASSFISFMLTGRISTDRNNITLSGLNDIKKNDWSKTIIDAFNIPENVLPELTDSFETVGFITSDAAEHTGLKVGIPVIAGGGDASCESYSIGIAGTNKLKIRMGSAADMSLVIPISTMPPGSRLSGLRDVLPEHMLVGQYTKSCAASVKWARNVFYSEIPSSNDAYSKMDQDAQLIPVGADGLTFHPYLTGENAPYFDSNLRAKFSGINIGHTRGHFTRAVYEGVSFSILDVLNSFAIFQMATDIIFVGGGTKSKVWLQILSDVLGKAGTAAANGDASFGAALIAGEGAGVFSAAEAIKMNISQGKKITPTDSTYAYRQFFENYKQLAGK